MGNNKDKGSNSNGGRHMQQLIKRSVTGSSDDCNNSKEGISDNGKKAG